MILLSIVVPVYCVEAWIARCLLSIVSKPVFSECCELIIVDDGSTDGSVAIAEEICSGMPQVRIIRKKNQGLGAARNTGAAHVKGAYLWFIDSDDWLTDEGLEAVVGALKTPVDVDVINIDYVMSNGLRSPVVNNADPTKIHSGIEYLRSSCVQNPVQYYIWSAEFYREYDLKFEYGIYHEDALFTPIALSDARRVSRLQFDCYVYNLREGSIMTSGNYLKHALDMISVVDKLENFRISRKLDFHSVRVLAKYSTIAIGGIFYYWKRLSSVEKIQVDINFRPWRLIRPILYSGRFKYLIAVGWIFFSSRVATFQRK